MKRLTQFYDRLTDSEKRVCSYISHNVQAVLKMSSQELAEKTHTSKTVVINTTQKLGFEGYTDLKYYLRDALNEVDPTPSSENFRDNVVALTKMTGNLMNYANLEKAAQAIIKARTVYIAARGTSKSVAQHLSHMLLTVGIKCILLDDYNLLTIIPKTMDIRELMVAISLSGETRKIIEATKAVKSRNATLISLTSFTNNALAKISDINLYTASESVATATDDSISRIGMFMLVEMVVNEVKRQQKNDLGQKM